MFGFFQQKGARYVSTQRQISSYSEKHHRDEQNGAKDREVRRGQGEEGGEIHKEEFSWCEKTAPEVRCSGLLSLKRQAKVRELSFKTPIFITAMHKMRYIGNTPLPRGLAAGKL